MLFKVYTDEPIDFTISCNGMATVTVDNVRLEVNVSVIRDGKDGLPGQKGDQGEKGDKGDPGEKGDPQKIIEDTIEASMSGAVETVIKNYSFEPGTFLKAINIPSVLFFKGGAMTTGALQLKMKISNTNNFASALQIAQNQLSGGNISANMDRFFPIVNGNLLALAPLAALNSDNVVYNLLRQQIPIDVNSTIYMWISCVSFGSGDIGGVKSVRITN